MDTFDARAVRPLVSFLVDYVFVQTFHLDLMTSIVNSFMNASLAPGPAGQGTDRTSSRGGEHRR